MYNNTIIQTNYKPYIPPPKKKISKNEEQKESEAKSLAIKANNYSDGNERQKPSSDAFSKSAAINAAKININQLLIDFNSTLNAIGATEDVENEVKTYLGLVEHQAKKEKPNKKMIISNLKIAADVLDIYISETLNKPSKVVKDWVDALLLQNIDFKADENITKGAFESITGEQPQTAKLAEKKLAQKAQLEDKKVENTEFLPVKQSDESISTTKTNSEIENTKIQNLMQMAEEHMTNSPTQALNTLSEAFTIAQKTSDKSSMAEIYSKIAQVQNQINNLPQALDCLNASTILAYSVGNDMLKTKNHKQMGKIYDEAGYMDTAISHYFASIAIDGNLDDTENQADTLNKVGKMYTVRYIEPEAVEYYKDALDLAKITKNTNMMSDIFHNTAITFQNAGTREKNAKALNSYKNAAILAQKASNDNSLTKIYEHAADLMLQMNHLKRAGDLYKKSYRLAEKTNNKDALKRIKEKILNL